MKPQIVSPDEKNICLKCKYGIVDSRNFLKKEKNQ